MDLDPGAAAPSSAWNGHVDHGPVRLEQIENGGGGVMGQGRARAACEDGCHQPPWGLDELLRDQGIDALVDAMQPADV